eukprot:scaffold13391_cov65-Phaeocystis_antarctica.AAC.8
MPCVVVREGHKEGTTVDQVGLSSGSIVQEAAAGRPSCSRVAFLAVSHASRKRSSTRSFPRALPLAVAWCARASRSAASPGTLGPPCTRRGGKLAWRRLSGLAVQPGSPSACRATSRLLTTAWSPVNGCSRSVRAATCRQKLAARAEPFIRKKPELYGIAAKKGSSPPSRWKHRSGRPASTYARSSAPLQPGSKVMSLSEQRSSWPGCCAASSAQCVTLRTSTRYHCTERNVSSAPSSRCRPCSSVLRTRTRAPADGCVASVIASNRCASALCSAFCVE